MSRYFTRILIVAYGSESHNKCAAAPQASGAVEPSNVVASKAVKSDFAFLYQTLQHAHYDMFAHRPKADYYRLYRAQMATIRGPMTSGAVASMFLKFYAYGRIGHALIDAPLVAFVDYLLGSKTQQPHNNKNKNNKEQKSEPA